MGNGQHRAGFRHAVTTEDIDPFAQCGPAHGLGQGGPADEYLPARQVGGGEVGVTHEQMQDGRHAVRQGDLFLDQQVQQQLGCILAGINLLDAQSGGNVGESPGVNMKHGSDGHVDILLMKTSLAGRSAHGGQNPEGVQYQLPVTEVNPLGQAGGAGGVKSRRPGVLIKISKIKMVRGGIEQRFIFPFKIQRRFDLLLSILEQHVPLDCVDTALDLFQNGQKLLVDQQVVIFGVVNGVQNLLG